MKFWKHKRLKNLGKLIEVGHSLAKKLLESSI